MPIEIKELHIHVTVETESNRQTFAIEEKNASKVEARESIVAECVDQVLHILQNKMER